MIGSVGYLAMGRLLFAALFLLLSASQPGLYATANATGAHVDGGNLRLAASAFETKVTQDDGHRHETGAAETDTKHAGAKKAAGKSCVVHCAPSQAVPVGCPQITSADVKCFVPARDAVLAFGEYAEFAQPPRSLG